MTDMDGFDRNIIRALQSDGRLTNGELGERVGLSASQCSRRRSALEESGIIRGYTALIDSEKVGVNLTCIISVTLTSHNDDNADQFRKLLLSLDNVQEAFSLTGEMDYSIKVVSPDLKSLSRFISDVLLPQKAVQNVKSAIVLDTIKSTLALPISSGGTGGG
ncbi:MAG: winged helix-turn-helix transcriptional regulator [Rhizobiaceae bacterium]|nr:winged helix-turn-helix transcriptional regulator [Rhizobiaceae bacterium]